MKKKKMSTVLVVILGIIAIAIGTFILWYIPYREEKKEKLEVKESGNFLKRLSLRIKNPLLCFGESCFEIGGEDHVPILTDGKGAGKLYVPSENGKGDGILYAWIQNQEMKISLTIYNKKREVISFINGNDWIVNKSENIDCNYNLDSFEVVEIKNGITKPLLQIVLKEENIQMGFETYLKDGTKLFWGNNIMSFVKPNETTSHNNLKPLFAYPATKNFGKRSD